MRSITLLALSMLIVTISPNIYAQAPEEAAVQATIETLFEGMYEADGEKVSGTFMANAIMQTIVINEVGESVIRNGDLQAFTNSIRTAEPGVLNEEIKSYEIQIDGRLASVWTPYEFYVGEEFSHCGANSFQLMNTAEGWKIFHIVDTRRRDNCS